MRKQVKAVGVEHLSNITEGKVYNVWRDQGHKVKIYDDNEVLFTLMNFEEVVEEKAEIKVVEEQELPSSEVEITEP